MLNLNNTLDGYLKNVEVIGNTIQDENNLADIRSVGDKVEGQELYNISIQVDNGDGVSEVVEILSPVQLEKVGDVADRIICKDGVWGVEKNVTEKLDLLKATWTRHVENDNNLVCKTSTYSDVVFKEYSDKILANFTKSITQAWNGQTVGISTFNDGWIYLCVPKNLVPTIDNLSTYLNNVDAYVICRNSQPQFIPLPHDQQVKLRTFAGQTNVFFNTEIPGQIKAQVPKSLGATVNTHTEQIADLHNSLDRVKRLEETTVSTVETESNFTTVDATSNGYFEGVKLEGKTLVNLSISKDINIVSATNKKILTNLYGLNKEYTIVFNSATEDKNVFIQERNGELWVSNIKVGITKGLNVIKFTSSSSGVDGIRIGVNGLTSYPVNITNILILEGDHTNNPPSYFEGLMSLGQDVEEVSVESVSDGINNSNNQFNEIQATDGSEGSHPGAIVSTYHRISADSGNIKLYRNGIEVTEANGLTRRYYRKDKSYIGSQLTNDAYYVRFRFTTRKGNAFDGDISEYKILDVGLNEQICDKKPLLYYNPTTETWEKPILREWDTIEKHSDGKYYYHKRSGEVVLNGSEAWASSADNNTTIRFAFRDMQNIKYSKIIATIPTYMDNDNFIVDKVSFGICSRNNNTGFNFNIEKSKLSTQDVAGFKAWLKANPTTVVYQLAKEEVYECTNIDLMTYSGETNYIINSGAISPKSLLKVHNNISNVVKILQEKVSLLENTFIAGLKSVLSGDMYSLATILYPEDFEQNDNTEQDIMVIPE